MLPEVLKESIDVETHPDFLKGKDGKRSADNGINKDVLVHRCYGAASIDAKLYRVKITLKEDVRNKRLPSNTHSYEATKIELLAGTLVKPEGDNPNTNNSISAANLLKNIGLSYNPSEKVLDASEKRTKSICEQRVYHGTGNDFDAFDHSHMGEGEGAQAHGWGTYVTKSEGVGRKYATKSNMATGLKRSELDSNINRAEHLLPELETLEFVRQGHNVVLYGNPGTGKTHLAIGLGIEACKNRMSVMFTSVPHLITQIKECRSQRTLHALETRFKRYDLVICDEFGYMACDKEGGELLFNHLSLRTDTKSTIITTNLSFDRWREIIKDKILVNALVDRLTHNTYLTL